MSMQSALNNLVGNLGLTYPDYVLLIFFLAGILFYQVDFRKGLMLHVLAFACLIILFSFFGYETEKAVLFFFLLLVTMALSLYTSLSKTGGNITP